MFNLRDLGGYATRDGATTRWGRVFRSDGLHRTDDAGGEVVIGLGIRRVIDLRTAGERDREGVFSHALVEPLHVPLIDRTWNMKELGDGGEADFLLAGYLHMAHVNGSRVGEVIGLVASHASEPILFHCAAGKDRTGIIAALLLALAGVDDETIAEDFALSEPAMAAMTEWYRSRRRQGFAKEMREWASTRTRPCASCRPGPDDPPVPGRCPSPPRLGRGLRGPRRRERGRHGAGRRSPRRLTSNPGPGHGRGGHRWSSAGPADNGSVRRAGLTSGVATGATVLTTFLPCAQTGGPGAAATCSSPTSTSSGCSPASARGAGLWPLVPLVAGAALFAFGFGRLRAGAVLSAAVGLAVAAAAIAVLRSPLQPLAGCWAGLATGLGSVALATFVGAFPHRLDDCESISTAGRPAQDVTP